MEINRKELKTKLELVIQKLMNLDGPENEHGQADGVYAGARQVAGRG